MTSVFEELAGQISVKAKMLKNIIPLTEHLVNDATWIKGQTKSELLTRTDQVALSKMAAALHFSIFHANKHYTSFYPEDKPIEERFEALGVASGLYANAKQAVISIKHLHVCQIEVGDAQLEEAHTLQTKQQAGVPKPVREQIALLASRYAASKAAQEGQPDAKRRKK